MTGTEGDPFAAYHRAGRRMTLTRVIPAALVCLAVAAGLGYAAGAAAPGSTPPPSAVEPTPAPTSAPTSQPPPPAAEQAAAEVALPQPVEPPGAEASAPPVLPVTGPRTWSIDIDTIGYQTEIDQCLWVRMELRASAPIVGAHNYCGGDIVLQMLIGDTVTLTGTGLDGTYTVAAERNAQAGDSAAAAVAGFGADVVLQTCYWASNGRERLLALVAAKS